MPNFDKDPGGYNMKPSGFKMKNSALNMSAKTGSPMQANYGGGDESPAKFLGGILRGVSRGIRGVQRKARGTVGKVARGVGLGGVASAIGLGKRKRGSSTTRKGGGFATANKALLSRMGSAKKGIRAYHLSKLSTSKGKRTGLPTTPGFAAHGKVGGKKHSGAGPGRVKRGGFGALGGAMSAFGRATAAGKGRGTAGPKRGRPIPRPATGSQTARDNKRRELFGGGLFRR